MVTWKASPSSDQTYIGLNELGLTEQEWHKMNKIEQSAVLNKWLASIHITAQATEWI